jgi:hypothetical protein
MRTDRVQRLNPETRLYVGNPLPRSTNIRRVWEDTSTSPATSRADSKHGPSIVRVEPPTDPTCLRPDAVSVLTQGSAVPLRKP